MRNTKNGLSENLAKTDAPILLADFLEERDRLDVLHGEREVDQALEVVARPA